jgi:hypothetical protein
MEPYFEEAFSHLLGNREILKECADFYVLLHISDMWEARQMLEPLINSLVDRFILYMVGACMGEASHAGEFCIRSW